MCADAGIRAHALGHRKGVLQQTLHRRAQHLCVARLLVGVLHLAEDLRLAQHHRVQPGGDAEHMANGRVFVVAIQELVELARRQLMVAT